MSRKVFGVIAIREEVTMKRMIIAVACLACGLGLADEGDEAQKE
jgi:hypothetical protein